MNSIYGVLKMKLALLLGVLVVIVGCGSSENNTFLENGVTAHRGNSGDFPENTMPAFKSAIEIGADWIELDVLLTKDNKLVVIHDTNTARVANQNLQVSEVTYKELITLDVAHDFRTRNKLSLKQCSFENVPLLEAVISLVMQQNKTRVSIQPKADCVKEVMALIEKMNAHNWVGFNDGNLNKMTEVKQASKLIPVFWDRPSNANIDKDLEIAITQGFETMVINEQGISKEKVDKIHNGGLKVGVWTVNDIERIKTIQDMGVDRFYTDNPKKLLQLQNKIEVN